MHWSQMMPMVSTKNDVSICFHTSRHSVRGKEVWDPNSVRADALDDSDGKDSAGRPLRYTHPSSHLSNEETLGVLGIPGIIVPSYVGIGNKPLGRVHMKQAVNKTAPCFSWSEQKITLFFLKPTKTAGPNHRMLIYISIITERWLGWAEGGSLFKGQSFLPKKWHGWSTISWTMASVLQLP